MDISYRIKQLRDSQGLNVEEFGAKIGVSGSSISNWETKVNLPKAKHLINIIKAFKLDALYFSDTPTKKILPVVQEESEPYGVPLYDVDASASNIEMFNDTINEPPSSYITMPDYKDCDFGARVYGDSMYPEIGTGDYVICKRINHGFSIIQYGEVYLIVTTDNQRMLKRIRKSQDKDMVTCESRNENFDSFDIQRDSIHNLFLVKGVIKRKTT